MIVVQDSNQDPQAVKITHYETMGEVSDGYHSFNELYEFRKLYNAVFFNELSIKDMQKGDFTYNPHKSWKHADGELCFGGGWFIVMAYLNGKQISNHYEAKDWDLFKIPELETANEWDGHTAQDIVTRLTDYIKAS
jgi:hypothetical protein